MFLPSLNIKQFFILDGYYYLYEFMTHYIEMYCKYNFDKYFA